MNKREDMIVGEGLWASEVIGQGRSYTRGRDRVKA